jgi:GH15 family glucan-1,4-alpha-glucosidase
VTRDASAALSAIMAVLGTDAIVETHLSKWLGSPAVDGSLSAIVGVMGVIDPQSSVGRETIAKIENDLVRDGGTFRYLGDTFFGGGQWPLLTCMLGQAHLAAGDAERARRLLEWAAATADEDGMMPEQVPDHLNDAAFVEEWTERWGPVARPLLWSHAMFLRLALDLGVVAPADLEEALA